MLGQDRVITELAHIAFSDMGMFVTRRSEGVTLRCSSELTWEKQVWETRTGTTDAIEGACWALERGWVPTDYARADWGAGFDDTGDAENRSLEPSPGGTMHRKVPGTTSPCFSEWASMPVKFLYVFC